MLRTYKAVIKDNCVIWDNDVHEEIGSDSLVPVYIILLEEPKPIDKSEQGRRMVSALNKLVKSKAFGDVDDPVTFIREMRQERELPSLRNQFQSTHP